MSDLEGQGPHATLWKHAAGDSAFLGGVFEDDVETAPIFINREGIKDLGNLAEEPTDAAVPPGYTLVLYDGKNFSGDSLEITGPHERQSLSSEGWNDRTVSAKLIENSAPKEGSNDGLASAGIGREDALLLGAGALLIFWFLIG